MESKFYQDAQDYWAKIPATVDGVLGGYAHIADTDIEGSRCFLNQVFAMENPPRTDQALDCGAGIGRVTKDVLLDRFDKVDLVEQDAKFLSAARQLIGENNAKLGSLYLKGLQHFKPDKQYDLIWCQWVLGHLKDYDLLAFLERCSASLNRTGVIVIKENITQGNELEYDDDDSSVTRPIKLMEEIFKEAQLNIVATATQPGFPEDLYPVHMFALRPIRHIMGWFQRKLYSY